jgi:predicted MFS family arabinose efflux permease
VEISDQMLSTFFPSWLLSKGLDMSDVGILFVFVSIGILLMAPFAPHVVTKYSPNAVQYYASWGFLCVRLSYLSLLYVPNGYIKPAGCACFFFVGLFTCLSETGSCTWTLMSVGAVDRQDAMGVMISLRSIAPFVALPTGGMLYDYGGYPAPFVASSAVFAVVLLVKRTEILDSPPPPEIKPIKNTGSILRNPLVAVTSWIMVMTFTQVQSCQVWWQPFMQKQYGFSSTWYGFTVATLCVSFLITGSCAGTLTEACGKKCSLGLGVASWVVGFLLIGPSPFLPFLPQPDHHWSSAWVVVIGMLLCLVGYALLVVILSGMSTNYAVAAGWGLDDAAAQNGMLNVVGYGIAIGIGPFMGSEMVYHYEIPWTSTCLAFWPIFSIGIPLCILALCDRSNCEMESNKPLADTRTDKVELLLT